MIDIEVLERHLTTKWVGRDRLLFEQTESTNDLAKYPRELIREAYYLRIIKTKGRGLSDKSWFGDAHKNLTFPFIQSPFT